MKSVFKTTSPEETMELGMQLAGRLKAGSVILLYGDLGSGKTHFTKGVAKGLGIDGIIKSPTFAYVNSYDLKNKLRFYHYDLYRLKQGDAFHSIGLEDTLNDLHAVNIIEWADRLDGLEPKDHIRVEFKSLADHHEITMKFEDSGVTPEGLVEKYWNDWSTPMHVRDHCKQVSKVGVQIAKALNDKNILVDVNLVNTACLLHDMSRICDFITMDKANFSEEVTDEKWAKWLDLREQFKGMHHGDIACGALMEDRYYKTGELIRLHKARCIMEESDKFSILEVAILYYADKRVKHDQIVSIADRFEDGRARYGHLNTKDEEKAFYIDVEKATLQLEEQLFGLVDLKPEDIH